MSQYGYKPQFPGKRESRRLHILPENLHGQSVSSNEASPADESTPVRCSVTHASLDHAPIYNALSYTWGDASITVPILVDEATFQATVNLEAALRHLRLKDEVVTLWVDALCINQNDVPEKNVQLSKMREIYVQAKSVIAWLGDTTPERPFEEKAMKFADDLREHLSPANSWHADLISALLRLFKRPYWSRIWIVQELASASNLIFVCGAETASDNALYDALRLLQNFT
ncbi:heterokaryon incompatibility protein-domain-containing protein [Amylocarpus encephaloides]|uniref:Heterokaryon incompatibility protein-domain-containing protein n=1 Tax=Amylocarpus encephaloides TaxID=45428 RepID=A0A9P7YGW9_9HELO|nr:heterokaryon incompatibility protein-domain-containing protein [Amylocarpus encephaloides]